MKILIVQESDWIMRNPHQQHHLLERLSLKDHKIRVIDYEIDWRDDKNSLISKRKVFKSVHKIHEDASVDVIRPSFIKIPLINYFSWTFSSWKEINRQIEEFKPDVIIGFGLINTYIASRAAKKQGIPFIYYLIDVLYTLIPEKSLRYIGKIIKKRIIKNSNLIIAINKKLSEFAIDMGAPASKVKVIGAGIDQKMFNVDVDGLEVRKKYHIPEKDTVLFFMGWIYHFSGVKEVAEELYKTNKENNIKLMVVGDGDGYCDLVNIQNRYKSDEKVILTGKQPYIKIPNFIAASDICILPAYPDEITMQEIVPIKIYEYMAVGKPIIATKLPGIMKEFGTESGIVYVDNPQDVVKNIGINIDEHGKKALNFVKNSDWATITDEFEKTLNGVIYE